MHLKTLTGAGALPYLDDLARLRITVFREWPYLYEGSWDYEREYLHTFFEARDSVLVLVIDGEQVVGASTGLPLTEETDNLISPFRQVGFDPERIFYFSESVLLAPYRGRGLGKAFFNEREAWARSLGRFDIATFCGVVRPQDHPRRQAGYIPLDGFWIKMGYQSTDLIGYISWLDLGEESETEKPLRFWMKRL